MRVQDSRNQGTLQVPLAVHAGKLLETLQEQEPETVRLRANSGAHSGASFHIELVRILGCPIM